MDYIRESKPIKVSGSVVASYGCKLFVLIESLNCMSQLKSPAASPKSAMD